MYDTGQIVVEINAAGTELVRRLKVFSRRHLVGGGGGGVWHLAGRVAGWSVQALFSDTMRTFRKPCVFDTVIYLIRHASMLTGRGFCAFFVRSLGFRAGWTCPL